MLLRVPAADWDDASTMLIAWTLSFASAVVFPAPSPEDAMGSGRRGLIFGFYPLFDFCSGQFYGTVSALGFTDFLLFSCIFYAAFSAEF